MTIRGSSPGSPQRAGSDLVDVLLVEDDPGGVLVTQEAFEQYQIRGRAARRQRR